MKPPLVVAWSISANGIRTRGGATAGASKDDRRALSLLSEVMAEDARPAVMLIVADGELWLYVKDHLGSANRKGAA